MQRAQILISRTAHLLHADRFVTIVPWDIWRSHNNWIFLHHRLRNSRISEFISIAKRSRSITDYIEITLWIVVVLEPRGCKVRAPRRRQGCRIIRGRRSRNYRYQLLFTWHIETRELIPHTLSSVVVNRTFYILEFSYVGKEVKRTEVFF